MLHMQRAWGGPRPYKEQLVGIEAALCSRRKASALTLQKIIHSRHDESAAAASYPGGVGARSKG